MKPNQKLNPSRDGLLRSISLIGPIVVLFVSPANLDPVNVPKMSILVILAGVNFAYAIGMIDFRNFPAYMKISLTTLILGLLVPLIFSDSPILQQMYGVFGRNSGFITYFAFILVFVLNFNFGNQLLINRTVDYIFVAGAINLFIGISEIYGINIFGLENIFKRPLGTLGNPDFYCAFLAITISLVLPTFLSDDVTKIRKLTYGVFVVLGALVITKSNIRQAQIMCLFAFAIFGYLALKKKLHTSKYLKNLIGMLFSVALSLVLFGAINVGPLGSLIYKRTMGFRVEYWKTSLNMFLAHPFSGVGLDGYSDNFDRFRPEDTFQVLGKVEYANASHNIFLDYLAGGGVVLAFGYLLITLIAFRSALRIIKNCKIEDPILGIVLAWILYQIQSFVSIGQIGISVLGWTFSGLILSFNTKVAILDHSKYSFNSEAKTLVFAFAGILTSFAIAMPPTVLDARWKNAVIAQDGERIFLLAKAWPYETTRLIKAADAFSKAGYDSKSLSLIRFALNFNDQSLPAWKMLIDNPSATPQEKGLAQLKIQSLVNQVNHL